MKNKSPHGTIYVKNGRYYARITYYVNGKRKTKDQATGISIDNSSKAKNRRQEQAALRALNEYLDAFVVPGSVVMQNIKEQMLTENAKAWFAHQCGSKAQSTIAGYQYALNDIILYFDTYLPIKTKDVTATHIEQYLNWERHRRQPNYAGEHAKKAKYLDGAGIENTVMHRATAIRSILQYAKRAGIVDRNVASKRDSQIDLPKPQRHEFPILNVEEAKDFLQKLEKEPLWFQVAVIIALLLGLRRSEIVGLRTCDIDWEHRTLLVRHTVTQQTIDGKKQSRPNLLPKTAAPSPLPFPNPFAPLLNL